MSNPLVRKLELGAELSDDDRSAIESALSKRQRSAAKTNLVEEGSQPSVVRCVLSGFACRYKLLPNGKRQIVGLLLPGDFCDLHVYVLGTMDHTISTITACEIALLSPEIVEKLITTRPNVCRALWWSSLVDEATLREWLLSIARRSASERMAHLICELRLRLSSVDLVTDDGFDFPINQSNLADILGISQIHANRSIQELRKLELVHLKSRRLQILDVSRLEEIADFDPTYLHLSEYRSSSVQPDRHLNG